LANPAGKRVDVLGFKGDPMASSVERLAREIDAVLTVAWPETEEIVLRLQSSGGTVTGQGLAADEIKVTVSADQVAASGGYMMACAADGIVATPFALIGSIGMVAQVPNLHRPAQEGRHRLRRTCGRRIQALRLDARRDHAGRTPPT
jgi:serine protease SohB